MLHAFHGLYHGRPVGLPQVPGPNHLLWADRNKWHQPKTQLGQLVDRARLAQVVVPPAPVNDLIGNLCKVVVLLNVNSGGMVEVSLGQPKLRAETCSRSKQEEAQAGRRKHSSKKDAQLVQASNSICAYMSWPSSEGRVYVWSREV